MIPEIKNKNIVLLSPIFHEYHIEIINELKLNGANVFFINNKVHKLDPYFKQSRLKILKYIYYLIFNPDILYFLNIINPQLKKIKIDYFIAINQFSLSKYLLKTINKNNKNIKSILYLWDSTGFYYKPGLEKYFSKIFTFDLKDSIKKNLEYIPNFYYDKKEIEVNNKIIYDLFFIGTQHSDRYNILSIIEKNKPNNITTYFKLIMIYKSFFHDSFIYLILKCLPIHYFKNIIFEYELFKGKIINPFITFQLISYSEYIKLFNCSNCILDIDSPVQSGCSQRIILALSKGKKIITTNENIKNEKFYNPNQIQIISRKEININYEWIKKDFEFNKKDFEYLRIDNWLKKLLE